MTVASDLQGSVGRVIDRVRRIFYVFGGDTDIANGPVEISLASGSAWTLDAGPDGERLAISPTAWIDPFEGDTSPENADWVRDHGKWTAFDVSADADYSALIGARISSVEFLDTGGITTGVVIKADGADLVSEVVADELLVRVTLSA